MMMKRIIVLLALALCFIAGLITVFMLRSGEFMFVYFIASIILVQLLYSKDDAGSFKASGSVKAGDAAGYTCGECEVRKDD